MVAGNQQQSRDVFERNHSRLRLYVPWLILSIGIILSIIAFFLVRNWEEAIISADFKMFATTRAAAIHREAIRHMDASTALVGLYDASREVDRQEFRQFSKEVLSHHADILAVMWLPRVSPAELGKLKRQAAQDGLSNLNIHEPNSIGSAAAHAGQSDYFPVYYVQPEEANSSLLGVDLMADSVYRGVLESARDSGEVMASSPVRLRADQASSYGMLLAQAVYQRGATLRTVAERRAALKGFVLQLFGVGSFVEESWLDGGILGLDLSVYYEMGSNTRQLSLLSTFTVP